MATPPLPEAADDIQFQSVDVFLQDFLAADGVMDLGPGFDPLAPFPSIQLEPAAMPDSSHQAAMAAAAVAAAAAMTGIVVPPLVPSPTRPAAAQPTTLTSQLQQQTLATSSEATATAPASAATAPAPSRPTRQRRTTSSAAVRTSSAAGEGAGGREVETSKNMKKHLALQEKNRRAQRRFRERQKQKVTELEAQVAELSAQLAAMAAEKSGLEQRTAALEKVAGGQAGTNAGVVSGSALTVQHPGAAGGAGGNTPIAAADNAPSSISQEASGGEEVLPAMLLQDLRLSLREGNGIVLSAEQVKAMTPMDLARYYKAYVNELAGTLVESSDPSSPATQARISTLVDEVCLLLTRVALCNPTGMKTFMLARVEEAPGGPSVTCDERVPQVVHALAIASQQRHELGQLRGLFLSKLGRIVGERRELHSLLGSSIPSSPSSSRGLAARYLSSHDVTRRLRDNLREEHILALDFVSTIFKHVLTPLQVANFMIHSFPWSPDCLALTTWVAAQDGDAGALALLAAEAQSRQAAAANVASSGSGHGAAGSGSAAVSPVCGLMGPAAVSPPAPIAAAAAAPTSVAFAAGPGHAAVSPFAQLGPGTSSASAGTALAAAGVNGCMPTSLGGAASAPATLHATACGLAAVTAGAAARASMPLVPMDAVGGGVSPPVSISSRH